MRWWLRPAFRDVSNTTIVYCSSIAQAVNLARSYANKIPTVTANQDIWTLSKEIKQEVHGDYFLAELITKGVAYHIGYLPSTIRMRIEELFRSGAITTIFCTSTLVEGVNMPGITSLSQVTKRVMPIWMQLISVI